MKDIDETDVDCGGACAPSKKCVLNNGCVMDTDCTTDACSINRTCAGKQLILNERRPYRMFYL